MPELFHDGSFYHIRPVETGGRGGGLGGAAAPQIFSKFYF